MKNNFFKRVRDIVFKLYLLALCLPGSTVARDFLSSVENASNEIRQIIAVVGVLALMIEGVCFYWSKKLGMVPLSELLSLRLLPQFSHFFIERLTKKRVKN